MMRVLRNWLGDAALSTARAWRTTVLALAVITTATLVVSLSLAFSLGVRSAVSRLAASAGMSVFLSDEAQEADVTRVADALRASPLVESVRFVSRSEARDRFVAAFPDLATGVREDVQALPLSFDVSLRSGAEGGVAALVEAVRADEAVSDVRYDQQWIARLERIGAAVGRAGFVLGVLLTLAAWTMLYAVVRLAYMARRDEIDILYLVGAPLPAIRGPFVIEGAGAGVCGALAGVAALRLALPSLSSRLTAASTGLGFDVVPMLPWAMATTVVVVAGLAGGLAAAMALRDAERHR